MKRLFYCVQGVVSCLFLNGCAAERPADATMKETTVNLSSAQDYADGKELELSGTSVMSNSGERVNFPILFSGLQNFDIHRCQGTLTVAGKSVPLQPMADKNRAYVEFSAIDIQSAAKGGARYVGTLTLSCN